MGFINSKTAKSIKKIPNNVTKLPKVLDKINNVVGNSPIASHPFFFDPKSSEVAVASVLTVTQKQPTNTIKTRVNGAVGAGLFNIDFNKRKKNKKVILNFN